MLGFIEATSSIIGFWCFRALNKTYCLNNEVNTFFTATFPGTLFIMELTDFEYAFFNMLFLSLKPETPIWEKCW
jgi:hypothetical protein